MRRFDKRVALVTGGATGIGLEVASRLGAEGASVIIVDYDDSLGKESVTKLNNNGVEAILEIGDVGDPSVARRSVRRAIEAWGQVDIMVNNAGITGDEANTWELPVEEMDRVYRTNLRGVFLFCREVVPHMLVRDYGRIVNIASVAGKEGNPRMTPYSATKAGVIGLTKSLGKELAQTGVRVNCITPAVVRTSMVEQISPKQVQYMVERIPLGRMGEVGEIAALVAWLASPECSFSTGAVFDISGGRATY